MKKLTEQYIFQCLLGDKPIELWYCATSIDHPEVRRMEHLLWKHKIFTVGEKTEWPDQRKVTKIMHPLRVFRPLGETEATAPDDNISVVDGVRYLHVHDLEIGDHIAYQERDELV